MVIISGNKAEDRCNLSLTVELLQVFTGFIWATFYEHRYNYLQGAHKSLPWSCTNRLNPTLVVSFLVFNP